MTDKLAMEIILDIIGGEQNEYELYADPLTNGGLDNYSVTEFTRRAGQKIRTTNEGA